jgi:hypothetical protein
VQKFSVTNFLGVNFLTFFLRIRTQHRILRFKLPISNFCKTKYIFLKVALFANCKVKRGLNKAKKLKTYFINVSYSSISGLGGSILSKKSTLFCPKNTLYNVYYVLKTKYYFHIFAKAKNL